MRLPQSPEGPDRLIADIETACGRHIILLERLTFGLAVITPVSLSNRCGIRLKADTLISGAIAQNSVGCLRNLQTSAMLK